LYSFISIFSELAEDLLEDADDLLDDADDLLDDAEDLLDEAEDLLDDADDLLDPDDLEDAELDLLGVKKAAILDLFSDTLLSTSASEFSSSEPEPDSSDSSCGVENAAKGDARSVGSVMLLRLRSTSSK